MGVAPDGSPVAIYLALSGAREAELVASAIPENASILELGCGTGRVRSRGERVVELLDGRRDAGLDARFR